MGVSRDWPFCWGEGVREGYPRKGGGRGRGGGGTYSVVVYYKGLDWDIEVSCVFFFGEERGVVGRGVNTYHGVVGFPDD